MRERRRVAPSEPLILTSEGRQFMGLPSHLAPALGDEPPEVLRAVVRDGGALLVEGNSEDNLAEVGVALPGRRPCEHFVEDAAQSVNVGLLVELWAVELLGGHVDRGAARLRHDVALEGVLAARDSKVDQLCAAVVVQEDVVGLQVAVHNGRVQVGQGRGDVVPELQDVAVREGRLLLVIDAAGEGRPPDILKQDADVRLRAVNAGTG